LSAVLERQRGYFVAREKSCIKCFSAIPGRNTRYCTRAEDRGHPGKTIAILIGTRTTIAAEDTRHVSELHKNPRLFPRLADSRVCRQFVRFDDSARTAPQTGFLVLNKKESVIGIARQDGNGRNE